MSLRDLGDGCSARWVADHLDVVLPHDAAAIRFERRDGRVRACLRYAGGKTSIDVSFQPAAIEQEIIASARECGVDPNRWRLGTLAALREWTGALDWCPQGHDRLLAAIGALTHPLLRHVYERGHRPCTELPRWAVPVLRAPDAASAARIIAHDANRRLARALAASLVRQPPPAAADFVPLAYAVVGAGLVTVDDLANVLEAELPPAYDEVPDGEQIDEMRRVLALYPPQRRAALLLDAARTTSPVEMAGILRRLWWIRDRAEQPLPVRVRDLRDMCARLVPVVAGPTTPPTAPPTAPPTTARPSPAAQIVAPAAATAPAAPARTAAATNRRELPTAAAAHAAGRVPTPAEALRAFERPDAVQRRPFERPLTRPRITATVDATRWSIPSALLPIHHFRHRRLRFVVPTSQVELRQWGRRLRNCLGDYAPAMASGQSWLIGVEVDDQLFGCIEVRTTDRTVRQALGVANLPLGDEVLDPVLEALRLHRIIR